MSTPPLKVVFRLPLKGKALIEASAGTGKTWTLTGVILRLLLEESADGVRDMREIIATTFTRAAAAEMRARIFARLEEMKKGLIAIVQHYNDHPDFLQDDEELLTRVATFIHAHHWDIHAHHWDEVLSHILQHNLAQGGLTSLIRTFERVELSLANIDEMFIGTLDSLYQRWNNELSIETGNDHDSKLTPSAQQEVAILSHDILRALINQEDSKTAQAIARYLEAQDLDKYSEELLNVLEDGATLPPVETDSVWNRASYQEGINVFRAMSAQEIEQYFALWDEAAKQEDLNKNQLKALKKNVAPDELCFATYGKKLLSEEEWSAQDYAFFKQWAKIKINNPAQQLKAENETTEALINIINGHLGWEKHIAQQTIVSLLEQLQQALPERLKQQGKTTYSQQLFKIINALDNSNHLTAYLAHRYPVLLVDESQDLNRQQTDLLKKIYIEVASKQGGLLLLVGDPKQALYRFRGGDVHNYQRLKETFAQDERYQLLENFRSSPALINELNALYLQNEESKDFGSDILYEAVTAAVEERAIVRYDTTAIQSPIQWQQYDEHEIFLTVSRLLSPKSTYGRKKDGKCQQLQPKDILILANNNKNVQRIRDYLYQQGIAVEAEQKTTVWQSEVGFEFFFLLKVLQNPYQRELRQRLLAGVFFQCTLETIKVLEEDDTLLANLNHALDSNRDTVQCLQAFLSANWQGQNVWQRLAGQNDPLKAQQDVLDLRQAISLIGQFMQENGRDLDRLIEWVQKQYVSDEDSQPRDMPIQNNAVRIMTVHKAKGLQAPVVLLALEQKDRISTSQLIKTYSAQGQAHWQFSDSDSKEADKREKENENARLLYVALTRAQDLLVVFLKSDEPKRKSDKPKSKNFSAFARLGISEKKPPREQADVFQQSHIMLDEGERLPSHESIYQEKRQKLAFSGWFKSSFTALSRLITEDVDVSSPDFALADEDSVVLNDEPTTFAARFPKGAQAGTFLHYLLEILDTQNPHTWEQSIKQACARFSIAPDVATHLSDYQDWLSRMVHAPLRSGATLATLCARQKVCEMHFSLFAQDNQPFDIQGLNKIMRDWGKRTTLNDFARNIRFLRGEIDLCYQYQDKFYIIDYKSNYLGNSPSDYQEANMQQAMDTHDYHLQALIYQLALHRYLQRNLPDYDPQYHLGGVEYFFLRGAQANERTGLLSVEIPFAQVEALDRLLQGGVKNL